MIRKFIHKIPSILFCLFMVFLCSACSCSEKAKLDVNIVDMGEGSKSLYLKWNSISKASKYVITYNGIDYESNTTFTSISLFSDVSSSCTITVKALTARSKTIAEETVTFQFLDTPSNIHIENVNGLKVIKWDEVPGATGYNVVINNTDNYHVLDNEYYLKEDEEVSTLAISSSKEEEIVSDYYIRYVSKLSKTFKVFIQKAIDSSKIKYQDEIISWTDSGNANSYSYSISIDGKTVKSEIINTRSISFPYSECNGNSFTFTITALGKSNTTADSDSLYSDSLITNKDFIYYDNNCQIDVNQSQISWDTDQQIVSYVLLIEELSSIGTVIYTNRITTDKKEYNDFKANTKYNISILPIHADANYFTTEKVLSGVTFLKAPELKVERNGSIFFFTWNIINNASGYTIKVLCDEEEVYKNDSLGKEATSFIYNDNQFNDSGIYSFMIFSKGDKVNYFDSFWSEEIKIEKLEAPYDLTGKYVDTNTPYYELSFVGNSSRYTLLINGTPYEISGNTYKYTNNSKKEEKITFELYATSPLNANNVIDSDKIIYEIIKLAPPSNVRLTSQTDISWNSSEYNIYDLKLDGNVLKSFEGTSININNLISSKTFASGEHELSIRNNPNGTGYYPSEYAIYSFSKCYSPTDIIISNNILTWAPVGGLNSGYSVIANGKLIKDKVNSNNFSLINENIEEDGTSFAIKTLGNLGENTIDSDPSSTYIVYKLSRPRLSVADSQLLINDVLKNTTQLDVYINELFVQTLPKTTVKKDLNELLNDREAGTYNITIKAKGNYSNYFDSDFSQAISITKLEKPIISINNYLVNINSNENVSYFDYEVFRYENNTSTLTFSSSLKIGERPHIDKNNTLPEGDLYIHGKAIGDGRTSIDSEYSDKYFFEKILPPVITMKNEKMTFTGSHTGYKVILDNTNSKVVDYNNAYSPENISEGDHNIKVTSLGDGVRTIDSFEAIFEFSKLSSPQIKMKDSIFTWDVLDSNLVKEYEVNIDNTESQKYKSISSIDIYNKKLSFGVHTINIKAIGDDTKYISSDYCSYSFTVLKAPNLSLDNNILSIESIANSIKYEVLVDDEYTNQLTTNKLDLSALSLTAGNHNLRVKAIAEGTQYISSNYTLYSFSVLSAPTLILNNGVLSIQHIDNATNYELFIDGVYSSTFMEEKIDLTTFSLEANEHTLNVKAKGSGKVYVSSSLSKAINIVKIETPKITINDGLITWNTFYQTKFRLMLDGNSVELRNGQINVNELNKPFNLDNLSEGEHSLSVTIIGEGSYISSDESNTITFTKLGKPSIEYRDGIVYFNKIDYTIRYQIIINQNTASEKSFKVDSETYSFNCLKEFLSGVNTVSVKALGDNKKLIDSDNSDIINIEKLSTPTNIAISNNIITWDIVLNNNGYVCQIDDGEFLTIYDNSFDTSELSSGSYSFKIYALGNDKLIINSDIQTFEFEV